MDYTTTYKLILSALVDDHIAHHGAINSNAVLEVLRRQAHACTTPVLTGDDQRGED